MSAYFNLINFFYFLTYSSLEDQQCCSHRQHNHPSRQNHRLHQLKPTGTDDDFDTGKLQLLSVLCIETSHYVCFTRVTENEWVFFDSMAERLGRYFTQTVHCI